MFRFARILFLSLALLGALPGTALADRPRRDRDYAEEGRRRHENQEGERNRGDRRGDRERQFGEERQRERRAGISADQAVRRAQQRYNAKVVRIQTRQEGDRTVYHLRLMSPDGTIRDIRIDASTGSEL